jgi:UDP-glucose 4-epimerase
MNVLVIGGAGYIGSHCVRQLQQAGHRPVVLDNLVYGHREAVAPDVAFHEGDLGDRDSGPVVAARGYRPPSCTSPPMPTWARASRSVEVLRHNRPSPCASCRPCATRRGKFVFSSNLRDYGIPTRCRTARTCRSAQHPYGRPTDTSACCWPCARAFGLSFASFRYIPRGGASDGRQHRRGPRPGEHLIPLAIWAAMGMRDKLPSLAATTPPPTAPACRDYCIGRLEPRPHRCFRQVDKRAGPHLQPGHRQARERAGSHPPLGA